VIALREKLCVAIWDVFYAPIATHASLDKSEKLALIRSSVKKGKGEHLGACLVIHAGNDLPVYDYLTADMWVSVGQKLRTHYCEPVNGDVIGVYEK
jgi:hypothetical protein